MNWMRDVRTVGFFVSWAVVQATDGAAQSTGTDNHGEWFGFAVAAESLPGAAHPVCGSYAKARSGTVLSASLALPLGAAIGIEGRLSHHWLPQLACLDGARVLFGSATVETAQPNVGSGNFAAMDARFRIAAAHGLVTTLGGGWAAASKDMPYVVGSLGVRHGARARFALDLEFTSYRVGWTRRIAEYQADVIVRELSSRQYSTWETGFALRFGVEVLANHQGP